MRGAGAAGNGLGLPSGHFAQDELGNLIEVGSTSIRERSAASHVRFGQITHRQKEGNDLGGRRRVGVGLDGVAQSVGCAPEGQRIA